MISLERRTSTPQANMIHCYSAQELVAKSEHDLESQDQVGQIYFMAGSQQGQQQHQQRQLVDCCLVCHHQLPCACNYHQTTSNEFYDNQHRDSKSSSANSSPRSVATAAPNQQHLQQHQSDSSQTSNSSSSHHHGVTPTQISESSCADGDLLIESQQQQMFQPRTTNKTLDHHHQAESQQAEQPDELYGRLYDIEPQDDQKSSWTAHLDGFDFASSSSSSLDQQQQQQQQRPQQDDYLHSDHNNTATSASPSTSSGQNGTQAYREQSRTNSLKQHSCSLNDFNNNVNQNHCHGSGANSDDQQRPANLSFALLMPIIETTSLEHISNDQRNPTNDEFYHHHYNSSNDYLSCFSGGGNNSSTGEQLVHSVSEGNKLAAEKQQQYNEMAQNPRQHHHNQDENQNNSRHHQHHQHHHHHQQQEHSPNSTSSGSNLTPTAISTNDRQQFYNQQYQTQAHAPYNQAIRIQDRYATTSSSCDQRQQRQQQTAIFQDYYSYTDCDASTTATSQQQQQQQYHSQDMSGYQDQYQANAQFGVRPMSEQDGGHTRVSYEPAKDGVYQLSATTTSSTNSQLLLISSSGAGANYHPGATTTNSGPQTTLGSTVDHESGTRTHTNKIAPTVNNNSNYNKPPMGRTRRGRPRKKSGLSKGKVSGKLWEFIRDLLLSEQTNPSFIRWERRDDGVFKFVQSDKVAKMWGERKQNPKMTYEKLSRAMRYYYKSKVLLPVFGRRLVYRFGPNATGWMCSSSAESSPSHSHHAHQNHHHPCQELDLEHAHHEDHRHLNPHHHQHHQHHHHNLLDQRMTSIAQHNNSSHFDQDANAIIY